MGYRSHETETGHQFHSQNDCDREKIIANHPPGMRGIISKILKQFDGGDSWRGVFQCRASQLSSAQLTWGPPAGGIIPEVLKRFDRGDMLGGVFECRQFSSAQLTWEAPKGTQATNSTLTTTIATGNKLAQYTHFQ